MTHLDPKAAAEALPPVTEAQAWLVGYLADLHRNPNRFAGEIWELEIIEKHLAALAALPQAEPVLWRYCNHDINGDPWPWSYTERRPEPGSYSEIEPLFASPVSREDVIEPTVTDHKWFDPHCHQSGCQSLVLIAALKRLSFAAQTTGGTAGSDPELQDAIAQAERALSQPHSEK